MRRLVVRPLSTTLPGGNRPKFLRRMRFTRRIGSWLLVEDQYHLAAGCAGQSTVNWACAPAIRSGTDCRLRPRKWWSITVRANSSTSGLSQELLVRSRSYRMSEFTSRAKVNPSVIISGSLTITSGAVSAGAGGGLLIVAEVSGGADTT